MSLAQSKKSSFCFQLLGKRLGCSSLKSTGITDCNTKIIGLAPGECISLPIVRCAQPVDPLCLSDEAGGAGLHSASPQRLGKGQVRKDTKQILANLLGKNAGRT